MTDATWANSPGPPTQQIQGLATEKEINLVIEAKTKIKPKQQRIERPSFGQQEQETVERWQFYDVRDYINVIVFYKLLPSIFRNKNRAKGILKQIVGHTTV